MKLKRAIFLSLILVLIAMQAKSQSFQYSPSEENDGDFPKNWELIKGSAQVTTFDGIKVVRLETKSIIAPKIGNTDYLSNNFTVEFDAYFDKATSFQGTYYGIRFWSGTTMTPRYDNENGKGSYSVLKIFRHGITLGTNDEINGSRTYRTYKPELEDKNASWRILTINYKQGALRIMIDNVPIIHIPDYKLIPSMVSIEGYAQEGYTPLVSAIRSFSLTGIKDPNATEHNTNFGIVDTTTQPELIDTKVTNNDPSGLEAIDEGNGIGWRLIGRDQNNFGNVGKNAVDLSNSPSSSTTNGATGNNSFALGLNTIASNHFSIAIGHMVSASGNTSIAIGENIEASGSRSLVVGSNNSLASGDYSIAMGRNIKAEGENSFATGYETIASGDYSTALGYQTKATGEYSTAIGFNTSTNNFGSTVVGAYNDPTVSTDIMFQVGNGYSYDQNSTLSNALSVHHDGVVLAPSFDLNEITDLKALVTKEYVDNNISGLKAIDEGNGIGWRLSARNSNHYGNIGKNAVDFSHSSSGSTSKGALGNSSFAAGTRTEASGAYSFAVGSQTKASGAASTSVGRNSIAQGNASLAAGNNTKSQGDNSVAFGKNTIAKSPNSLVIGKYNSTVFDGQEMLFQVGNGTSETNRKDLFWISNNGNARLEGDFFHDSDFRLKTEITSLNYGLSEILELIPKSYYWKNKKDKQKSIGLIAQDVQPIIKEIVFEGEDKDKTLSLNYSALIPVLINAIQEQQDIISNQDSEIKDLKVQLQSFDLRIKSLETDPKNSQQ